MTLARTVGLNVPTVTLRPVGHTPCIVVQRYDRSIDACGSVERVHQEDFCQALGYPNRLKYEDKGGPGLAACSDLVRRLALGPDAVRGLLDSVVFNALIGNADAHAKNLSLLCDRTQRRSLAPLYDLVPTIYLPESLVERTPAMHIGGAARIDGICAEDWIAFARAARYGTRYVLERVQSLADAVLACMAEVGAGIVAQGGAPARVARVVDVIADNARRTRDAARPGSVPRPAA